MASMDLDALKQKIAALPRKSLIYRPTPLHRLDRLTEELSGPEVWIKRDDLTGLAFGGNKSRKLEFIIADALAEGADAIITWASVQSNWCLQTAAAARKYGLKPVLLLFNTSDLPLEDDGNLLLDRILDADVRFREAEKGKIVSQEYVDQALTEVVGEVKTQLHTPYVVSVGGSATGWSMAKPLGAIAYFEAFIETFEQAQEAGVDLTHIVHATGSGSTQAGLALGAKALKTDARVIGISVSESRQVLLPIVREIGRETVETLELDVDLTESDVIVRDEYVKDGYGRVNQETAEAIRLLFRTEGIVLDPIYTGKAFSALTDLIGKGHFKKTDKVVFFHTGGTPALFPYRKPLLEFLR